MALLNVRAVENKSGYDFNAVNLSNIYAEDILQFKGALETSGATGSEVYVRVYNVTTAERDALTTSGSGQLVFNSTDDSLQVFKSGSWSDVGGVSAIGSLEDVNITGLSDNDILSYDSGTGSWVNTDDPTFSNVTLSGSLVDTNRINLPSTGSLDFYNSSGTLLMKLDSNGNLGVSGQIYQL